MREEYTNEYIQKVADPAFLRVAFEAATREYAGIYSNRPGKLGSWQPSKDDLTIKEIWVKLYRAVRDTSGGLEILNELTDLRGQIEQLEQENCRLNRALQAGIKPAYTLAFDNGRLVRQS